VEDVRKRKKEATSAQHFSTMREREQTSEPRRPAAAALQLAARVVALALSDRAVAA
jgi:hypothetical protein